MSCNRTTRGASAAVVLGCWFAVISSGCIVDERRFSEAERRDHLAALEADEDETESSDEAGEEEQEGITEGDPVDDASPECAEYCERVMDNCTDEFAVYASLDSCLSVCALLPLEGEGDNNVACRTEQARLAGSTGEQNVHCPPAGPGGSTSRGGSGCGTNCESYCFLQPLTCGDTGEVVLEANECLRRCRALPDEGNFDVVTHHDGDNVQCRLIHVASAALGETAAETHCWHAAISPPPMSPCGLLPDAVPSCEHYCKVATTACIDDHTIYEDIEQCLAVCEVMDPGEPDHTVEDTVGCRLYHAYAAMEAPGTHCSHASAAGDGHCGVDNCETYCRLAEALCADEFADNFEGADACLAACAEIDGAEADSGFDIESASSGDTVACRAHHLALSTEDPALCAAVFGGSPCD